MAFGVESLAYAGLVEDVIPYLTLEDVYAVEVLAPVSRRCVQQSDAWYRVACSEITAFSLPKEERTDKQHMKKVLLVLQKALTTESFPIPLGSIREASDLAVILQKFHANACAHHSKGGVFAKVLVGCFRFDQTQTSADHVQTRLKNSMPEIVFSKPASAYAEFHHASCTKAPAKLSLTMALEKNRMLMGAKLEGDPSDLKSRTRHPKLLIDVRAMSSALLLQMRGIKVEPDGLHYEIGSGLCSKKVSQGVFKACLTEGIMCALLVRDDPNPDGKESVFGPLADSLHLDRVRSG